MFNFQISADYKQRQVVRFKQEICIIEGDHVTSQKHVVILLMDTGPPFLDRIHISGHLFLVVEHQVNFSEHDFLRYDIK